MGLERVYMLKKEGAGAFVLSCNNEKPQALYLNILSGEPFERNATYVITGFHNIHLSFSLLIDRTFLKSYNLM
jgi:hypothetical protein